MIFAGFLSGLIAGLSMGLMSHAGYREGFLKSSLFIIDGSFALKVLGLPYDERRAVLFGVPVHLATSVSFGIAYAVLTQVLNVVPTNISSVAVYIFVLWLSMLFIALPIAGHGLVGRRLSAFTWFEQFLLHVIFGLSFLGILYIFE